jgi:hypothetical protein
VPRPLRPPRGIFSPTGLLFDPELPDTVKTTAMQLRALGWGQDETPALSMKQICQELGKSQATLYGHMRLLRLRGALRWRPAGPTEIIVSFEPGYWLSENLEKPSPLPVSNKPVKRKAKEDTFQNSGKSEKADLFPLATALADVCKVNLEANRGRLFSEAKTLSKAQPMPTPELIRQHYNGNVNCFWRARDWRGKKGELPTPAAIRQTWGQWSEVSESSTGAELRRLGYVDANGKPV